MLKKKVVWMASHSSPLLETKTKVLKLNTFHEQKAKAKRAQSSNAGKSYEVVALLRMAQLVASGSDLDINNFIRKH